MRKNKKYIEFKEILSKYENYLMEKELFPQDYF